MGIPKTPLSCWLAVSEIITMNSFGAFPSEKGGARPWASRRGAAIGVLCPLWRGYRYREEILSELGRVAPVLCLGEEIDHHPRKTVCALDLRPMTALTKNMKLRSGDKLGEAVGVAQRNNGVFATMKDQRFVG